MPQPPELFVVRVEENLNPTLAQREPCSYASPPQPHSQERALVQLLTSQPCDGSGPWRVPIAGGSRVIELAPSGDPLPLAA